MATTLSTVLAIIHAETGAGFTTQDQWWASVFYSYCHAPGNENLSNACVSKYMRGRRKISNKYMRFYSTMASLRVPVRLVADLSEHVKRLASVTGIANIHAGMVDYCRTLNCYDGPRLMAEVPQNPTDREHVAALCAAVLWYAMCYDIANA